MNSAFILLEDGRPAAEHRANLVTPWWSFGKTLIAAAALRLVEQGRLSLDRPQGGVSLPHLLRHEGGLRDYGWIEAYHSAVAAGEPPWPKDKLLALSLADQPVFAAGEGWSYSNIGYLMARERIEQAHGGDLGQAVQDLLFAPMGIEGARLARTVDDLAAVEMGAAQGYHPGWVYHGLFVGPLGAAAACLDRLLGPRSPLSAASLALMADRRALPDHNRPPWMLAAYGLGLMIPTTAAGGIVTGHTGGGPGSSIAVYRRDAGSPRTAAVFCLSEDQTSAEATAVAMLETGAP